jgi:formimidoylglutamate deiminase
MVNAHSHAFQRVIRGRTEYRSPAASDSFWTWREMMYSAAARLSPEDIYDASRMAFMEMTLSGITAVGEFHYLHRTPEGTPYDDPNLLAKEVVRAARDVGLRIALLRVAYARSGFQTPPNERQRRFIESDPAEFIRNAEALDDDLARAGRADGAGEEAPPLAWAGVAPHSVRAVPVEYARAVAEFARGRALSVHMHVAEQPAEVAACVEETGLTPVALLAENGLLDSRFTGVHAVHVTPAETAALANAGATVCACPTTERNLGDGVVPADEMFARGVRVALGTDSHAQIDLLEDARELEYHLRLQKLRRNVLAPPAAGDASGGDDNDTRARDEVSELLALAARLFDCATSAGAHSVGADSGRLAPGRAADFFTVDLDDPSVAGASEDDLLPAILFSMARTALRETAVGGRLVVSDGRHPAQEEVTARFSSLQRKLWSR